MQTDKPNDKIMCDNPPGEILMIPIHSRLVVLYEGGTKKSIIALGREVGATTYEACVLSDQGSLVYAHSIEGFVHVEEEF